MNGSDYLCARCECNISFVPGGQTFLIDGKPYCDVCAERLRQARSGPQEVCACCRKTVPKVDTGIWSGRRLCKDCLNKERSGVRPLDPAGWKLPPAEHRHSPKNKIAEERWESILSQTPPYLSAARTGGFSSPTYDIRRRCICFVRGDDPYETELICIDLRTGTPYLSCESTTGMGSALVTHYSQHPIPWQDFLAVAKAVSDGVYAHYREIDGRSWKHCLKAAMTVFQIP